MNQPRRSDTFRNLSVMASVLLWGVVEVVALARARWAMRLRHERGMRSTGPRGYVRRRGAEGPRIVSAAQKKCLR
jgi:hypothetical protein